VVEALVYQHAHFVIHLEYGSLHIALYEVFVQDEIKESGKQKPQGDADPTQADSYFS
jgi:hypothetical protein